MEIFELLFASPEMCGCLLEVGAALIDIWAGVAGYKYAKARHESRPYRVGPTVVLIGFAVLATLFVIGRWVRRMP